MDNDNITVDATDPQSWATVTEKIVTVKGDTSDLEKSLFNAEQLGRRLSSNLISQFEAVALKGKSLSGVFKSLALSLSDMVLKAAFAPTAAA